MLLLQTKLLFLAQAVCLLLRSKYLPKANLCDARKLLRNPLKTGFSLAPCRMNSLYL